jgi:hypothetical protein
MPSLLSGKMPDFRIDPLSIVHGTIIGQQLEEVVE